MRFIQNSRVQKPVSQVRILPGAPFEQRRCDRVQHSCNRVACVARCQSHESIPTLDAAEYAVGNAHQVCAHRATHDEATTQRYAALVIPWADGASASAFTDQAEFNYCTQYLPAGY
jgi:hypothetical protein